MEVTANQDDSAVGLLVRQSRCVWALVSHSRLQVGPWGGLPVISCGTLCIWTNADMPSALQQGQAVCSVTSSVSRSLFALIFLYLPDARSWIAVLCVRVACLVLDVCMSCLTVLHALVYG